MIEDHINYPALIDAAMRGVVRDTLRKIATTGLPANHHFFISFRTDYSGVRISDLLRKQYPHEMTIVIQHQFWDLKIQDDQFSVTLSFNNIPETLVIPFKALTAFADPSIKFGLQFHGLEEDALEETDQAEFTIAPSASNDEMKQEKTSSAAEVISLDAWRKK